MQSAPSHPIFMVYSNIILPSIPRPSKWTHFFGLSRQNFVGKSFQKFVRISLLHHMCSHVLHLIPLNFILNNTWWWVYILEFLFTYVFLTSSYFPFRGSNIFSVMLLSFQSAFPLIFETRFKLIIYLRYEELWLRNFNKGFETEPDLTVKARLVFCIYNPQVNLNLNIEYFSKGKRHWQFLIFRFSRLKPILSNDAAVISKLKDLRWP